MIAFFLHIYDWMSSHRRFGIGLLLLMVLLLVASLMQMHYSEDISDFLPQNEKSEKYANIYNQLGGQDKIVVIFEGDEDSVLEAMDSFGEELETEDTAHWVKDLQVQYDEQKMLDMLSFIGDNIPYFLEEKDYAHMDSLLRQPYYIEEQIQQDKQLLMLPTAGALTLNLQSDPLHLFSSVQNRLRQLNISDQYELVDDHLFTKEGHRGLVTLRSPFGMSESQHNHALGELIDSVSKAINQQYPQVRISSVGGPLIAVSNASQIKRDSILAVSISVILILAILLYVFRRLRDLGWIAFSLLFGGIFALGIMALYKDNISIIVLGIGSVIIGIAVNYPLHFLDHLRHETNPRNALKEMVPPLLIGNITTVGAFLCLVPLEAEAMRDLGAFGALTLVGTIVFVLIFLPILVTPRAEASAMGNFSLQIPRLRLSKRAVILPFILLTVVLGYFSLGTSFDADMQHINYMTPDQRENLKLMSQSLESREGDVQLFAVEEGCDIDSLLARNEVMLQSVRGIPSQVSSISSFVPSKREQEVRLNRWKLFWTQHPQVGKHLQGEAIREGFSTDAFAPFLTAMESSYEPQSIDYFEPITAVMHQGFLLHDGRRYTLVNYIQASPENAQRIEQQVGDEDRQFAFSTKEVTGQLVSILSNDFNYIGFVCGFIVFFFLWFSFGSMELSLLSFLPLGIGWIWILGSMQLFGIQFNIVNIILATFIFGQGDDYTIFITEGLMYEYAYGRKILKTYKNSVALSAIIMFVGIGTLILAKHPAMRSLAEVTLVGMFTVVLMAFYLPPLVYHWLTRRKGELRDVPITLYRIGVSLIALTYFLVWIFILVPFFRIYFSIGRVTEKKRKRLHRVFQVFSTIAIEGMPNSIFTLHNPNQENFEKPSIIICNHQSMLDLMAVMRLTPKLVIMTKDWVWNNIFFGKLVRMAEFYPASNGVEEGIEQFRNLMQRGYSIVIFPEGTRSADSQIHRFHQGACYMAQQLRVDILPLFLHGFGQVMGKNDPMLRRGEFYMEIGDRIHPEDMRWGTTCRERTSAIHRMYVEHYRKIAQKQEGVRYLSKYISYKYIYKGKEVEQRCKQVLRQCLSHESRFRASIPLGSRVNLLNVGQGEVAWLMALMHRDCEFYASDPDKDAVTLGAHCSHLPTNLHFCTMEELPENEMSVDMQTFIQKE